MPLSNREIPRLGLLVRAEDYGYQQDIIAGAHAESEAQGATLYCFGGDHYVPGDPQSCVYRLATALELDGVVVALGTLGRKPEEEEAQALLKAFGSTPCCVIGPALPGQLAVAIDNVQASYEATLHLVRAHGCQRLAFLTARSAEASERLRGVEKALGEAGLCLDPSLVLEGDFTGSSGAAAIKQLLESGSKLPDALVCANDWMAMGALDALSEAGLCVPKDIALVGFDDVEEARFCSPPLTTVRQVPRALAAAAVRAVLGRGQGGLLATRLEVRQSCGCSTGAPLSRQEPHSQSEALLSALGKHRALWVRTLAEVAPPEELGAPPDFAETVVDALLLDLQEGTTQSFTGVVRKMATAAAALGAVGQWHELVARLRTKCLERLSGSHTTWFRSAALFDAAQIAVAATAEATQAERRIRTQDLLRNLSLLGAELRTARDPEAIRQALLLRLGDLEVRRLFVCLSGGRDEESELAKRPLELLLAYERGRGSLVDSAEPFEPPRLLPQEVDPQQRVSLMVQPLVCDDRCLGYCALELLEQDPALFQLVPSLVASALRAATLFRAVVEEVERRQMAERARLAQELDIAARIQTGVLPQRPALPGLEIATAMHPATEVGGDYFDILPSTNGGWIGIGDVAGHGLHTGLMMLMIQSIVATAVAAQPDACPSTIWSLANRVLYDNVRGRLRRDEHATLTLLRYSSDGQVRFAGAHEDLLLYRSRTRSVETHETPGIWAGIRADVAPAALNTDRLQLEPGDVLLLYTDGIIEAQAASGEQFGVERLIELLRDLAERPVPEVVWGIVAAVERWAREQRDDRTLVVARYVGDAPTSRPN